MTGQQVTDRAKATVDWAISNPIAFLLWLGGVIIAIGFGFTMLNSVFPIHLPALGFNPQSSVYLAGIVWLLWGKV